MMNMVNNVFDFIRNIFTWADQNNRKRGANEPLPYEPELAGNNKRFRSNETFYGKELFVDIVNDENDDIEILSEYHSSPLRSSNQMNNNRGNRRRSFTAVKGSSFRIPQPKSSYQCSSNNSDMGYLIGKGLPSQNAAAVCKNSTLSRTHRLQEKRQYGELLQNFVPRRVHVLQSEPNKNHVSPIEVIELDKSDESQTSQKSIPVQKRQHYTPWKNETGKVFSGDKRRSNSQSTISRIQVEKEELAVKPFKPTERSRASGSTMPLKVLPTNTLREALASKSVLKKDLLPKIEKNFDERRKQLLQEAEELKRQVNFLSDTNRLTRELSLEEQLARTLKLCEAVIDDREEPEEEPLPTLTNEMLAEVRNALASRSSNEVLAEGFGLRVTRKDIQTLAGLNWLNDEVINFYMNLLIVRGTGDKFPKVHAMNTFFYPKLISGGHASLKRWTRKIDIFAMDVVVVPIHLGIHWCMSIIDFRDKTIRYFDSMGSPNPKCLVALRKYLEDESVDKKKKPYDTSDWKLESVKDIPQQMNGSDCGVFSCMFAEFICAKRRITFTQKDMPYFRNKMVYEILKARLL